MTAGLEMLRYAAEHDVYQHLRELGNELRSGLSDILADTEPTYTVVGRDSMFKLVFSRSGPTPGDSACRVGCRQDPDCPRFADCPTSGADVDKADTERWERLFWQRMKEEGILLTANQFEPQFLSYAHTSEDIEATLEAYKHAL